MHMYVREPFYYPKGCGISGSERGNGYGAGFYCVYYVLSDRGNGLGDGQIFFRGGQTKKFHVYSTTLGMMCTILAE